MARAIWTGALSFGLVTVPVGIYPATEDHTTHYHQIQRGTADRVRIRRTNERTGEEVAFGDIVKGYDLGDNQYVVIDPGELEGIAPGRSRVMEVSGFVDLAAVDPLYFNSSYYLAPRGEEFVDIYALLLEALENTGRAAIATVVMRGKQYLTAIRPAGRVLELHTLHYADEVRDPVQELPALPERSAVSAEQLAAAKQLIDLLSVEWKPEDYRDTYEDRVHELIDAKRAGQEIVTAEAAPEATNVLDLMEALQRSLDNAGGTPRRHKSAATAAASAESLRGDEELDGLSKAELYARATELDLAGRSRMTRDELLEALERARSPRSVRGRRTAGAA